MSNVSRFRSNEKRSHMGELIHPLGSIMGPVGPFDRSLGLKKTMETKSLLPRSNTTPSFRFRNIARLHALRMNFNILVGEKKFEINGERPIVLHPPKVQDRTKVG